MSTLQCARDLSPLEGKSSLLDLRRYNSEQTQNRMKAVVTSFVHIPVQLKCSEPTRSSPGGEKVSVSNFFCVDGQKCAGRGTLRDWVVSGLYCRIVSLTEMQMHLFKKTQILTKCTSILLNLTQSFSDD